MSNITFIAGGSKGLGAAMRDTFIAAKHLVIEFSRTGQGNHHIDCDFNLPEQAQNVFEQIFDTHSKKNHQAINLVINTAVLAPFGSIAEAENNQINQHLNINITTTVYLVQSFLAAFQSTDAEKSITYISSGAAKRAIPGLGLYSASKAFFDRLIDTLAAEQDKQNHPVKCMVINPGVMNTDMQAEIRSQTPEDFPMVDMWNNLHQQGQLAMPSDVALVCVELIQHSGMNGGYYTAQDLIKA